MFLSIYFNYNLNIPGASVSNDTPMSKKSRRRTQPEGPSVLLNSVSSTGGGHNRKASSNILSNIFSTSYNKVLEDFRKLFPPDDYNGNQGLLLTHYSCALQTDPGLLEQGQQNCPFILVQGKLNPRSSIPNRDRFSI